MYDNEPWVLKKGEMVNQTQYQRLVGKLIYHSHTRLDIAYVVEVASRFRHNPQDEHLDAVYKITRYLKKTPTRRVILRKMCI